MAGSRMDWTSAATLPGKPHVMALLAMACPGAPFHAGLEAACGSGRDCTNRFAYPARPGSQLRRTNLTRLSALFRTVRTTHAERAQSDKCVASPAARRGLCQTTRRWELCLPSSVPPVSGARSARVAGHERRCREIQGHRIGCHLKFEPGPFFVSCGWRLAATPGP